MSSVISIEPDRRSEQGQILSRSSVHSGKVVRVDTLIFKVDARQVSSASRANESKKFSGTLVSAR